VHLMPCWCNVNVCSGQWHNYFHQTGQTVYASAHLSLMSMDLVHAMPCWYMLVFSMWILLISTMAHWCILNKLSITWNKKLLQHFLCGKKLFKNDHDLENKKICGSSLLQCRGIFNQLLTNFLRTFLRQKCIIFWKGS